MHDQIEQAMARAFFALAWADMQEAKDADDPTLVNVSGKEIMDMIPDEIDPAALHAARTLVMDMERVNGMPLVQIWGTAAVIAIGNDLGGDRDLTPSNFGHYCAMQAMGTGVGLRDAFGRRVYEAVKVPYVEFGSHSLERDY